MEQKLKEILEDNQENMFMYQKEVDNYVEQLRFFQQHNLNEEERITRVKYDASNMILFGYKKMCNEIEKLLNDWNS